MLLKDLVEATCVARTPQELLESLVERGEFSSGYASTVIQTPIGLLGRTFGTNTNQNLDSAVLADWSGGIASHSFAQALSIVRADVSRFLENVIACVEPELAEVNAAIFLKGEKELGRKFRSIPLLYFCTVGLEHLTRWEDDWGSHPLDSIRQVGNTSYVVISSKDHIN